MDNKKNHKFLSIPLIQSIKKQIGVVLMPVYIYTNKVLVNSISNNSAINIGQNNLPDASFQGNTQQGYGPTIGISRNINNRSILINRTCNDTASSAEKGG
ncbi:MAG: hypothetical protein ACI35O_13505 [Bacillaceae bacterium]